MDRAMRSHEAHPWVSWSPIVRAPEDATRSQQLISRCFVHNINRRPCWKIGQRSRAFFWKSLCGNLALRQKQGPPWKWGWKKTTRKLYECQFYWGMWAQMYCNSRSSSLYNQQLLEDDWGKQGGCHFYALWKNIKNKSEVWFVLADKLRLPVEDIEKFRINRAIIPILS